MNGRVLPQLILTGAVLVLIGLVTLGCTTAAPTTAPTSAPAAATEPQAPPTAAAEPAPAGDRVRGGLLYDTWWVVLAADEEEAEHEMPGPTTDHPLWATQTTNTRSGADTWRCKECHGWDYQGVDGAYGAGSHLTGFQGVFASRDKSAAEIVAALAGGTNPDHDFSTVMAEQDLIDLALFITGGLLDADTLVNADGSSRGILAEGQPLYETVCTLCHGPAGNAINFGGLAEPEYLGHLAPDNPWEFIHKVRFGQPGWPMPSAIASGWTPEDVANLLAYVQTFATDPAVSGGGQLYDAWWEVIGAEAPADDQPLWATQTTNAASGADTWRCKECHGWDYAGADGAYGSGSHFTGFTGILGAASSPADELLAWLSGETNPDHDFSAVMDEVARDALVTFMQQEMEDVSAFINADKSVNGDAASGRDMFNGTCAACHGADGRQMNFGDAAEPEYVGTVAVDNPWEFFHKASFGQPGTPMPSGRALGWTLEDIADLAAYVQTLPTQ
jgi:thiosulfate dehydrogenase